jgi:hypothetical protein
MRMFLGIASSLLVGAAVLGIGIPLGGTVT